MRNKIKREKNEDQYKLNEKTEWETKGSEKWKNVLKKEMGNWKKGVKKGEKEKKDSGHKKLKISKSPE